MADLKGASHFSSKDQEIKHWWIRTRLMFLSKLINKSPGTLDVIEWGCGTGQNLYFLRKFLSKKVEKLTGIDSGFDAAIKEDWMEPKDYLGPSLPIPEEKYQFGMAMDVLEHIEDDKVALQTWIKQLEPGAQLMVTVPAFNSLWSYHDEALGHKRRYTKQSLRKLADEVGLETIKISYLFSWAYPLVFLARKFSSSDKKGTTDLKPANPLLNVIFTLIGKLDVLLGGCPFIGTSVVGHFRVSPDK